MILQENILEIIDIQTTNPPTNLTPSPLIGMPLIEIKINSPSGVIKAVIKENSNVPAIVERI
jgi:hypothetical protein